MANGLARNFLIPNGHAECATPSAIKRLESMREKNKKAESEKKEIMRSLLNTLNGKSITIKTKTTEKGGLFAKITGKEIARAIRDTFDIAVPEDVIVIPEPFKQVGEYEIRVKNEESDIPLKIIIESE